jgi:hypothetical protein
VSIQREDLRKVNVIFVHSDIDDLGLSLYEFRIYAHIARRAGDGECFPSISAIAKHCKCSEDTARETIQHLINYKLISREDRPGTSPLYRLTSSKEWNRELVGTFESKRNTRRRAPKTDTPPDIGEGLFTPPDIGEGCGHGGGHPSGHRGGHPSGHRGEEVHPIKLIQSEVIQDSPKATFHAQFIDIWCRRFQEKFGFKYLFQRDKDGKAVKNLSSAGEDPKTLVDIAERGWFLKENNFLQDQSRTICGFASKINEIRTATTKKQVW